MKTSKSKTFHQDTPYSELFDWMMSNLEINAHQPLGTDWSGGEPGPHDYREDLKHKYIITVTKVESI